MALVMVSTDKTEWNVQESSEDAEFRWRDDGQTRENRMVLRIVLAREHSSVSNIDFSGNTNLPIDVTTSTIQANGPTTVTFDQYQTLYKQLDVVSSRLVPFESKGGDFMQEILVIEGYTEWSTFAGDEGQA